VETKPPHYCTRLARYQFGIVIGLERGGRRPCRHPPFGALDQFLNENGYCITTVVRKAAHFRPGAGVENEPEAHLLAIDPKMAHGKRAYLSASLKVTDMAPAALIWLYHDLAADRKRACMACGRCAPPRGRSGENSSGGLNARWIVFNRNRRHRSPARQP
jgi:hypothetical protein